MKRLNEFLFVGIELSCNFFILPFLFLVIIGCANSDLEPCGDENRITVDHLALVAPNGGVLTLQNIDEKEDQVFKVIRTSEDYAKYFLSSTELPAIDFSNQVILAGRLNWKQCAQFKDQIVQNGCGSTFYKINIDQMDCLGFSRVYFFAVINREAASSDIQFETVIHK